MGQFSVLSDCTPMLGSGWDQCDLVPTGKEVLSLQSLRCLHVGPPSWAGFGRYFHLPGCSCLPFYLTLPGGSQRFRACGCPPPAPLHPHTAFSPVCVFSLPLRTPGAEFRAHPNPGQSHLGPYLNYICTDPMWGHILDSGRT